MPLLSKKYPVQKTFRLDEKVSEDLERLSTILERTQNDLANVAIETLLKDNGTWLAMGIFLDQLVGFVGGGAEEDEVTIQQVTVKARLDDDDQSIFDVVIRDSDGNVVEEFSKEFDSGSSYEAFLISLSRYLDFNTPDMKRYIAGRVDYS